jgi:acetyl esterase/lipase
MVSKGMENIIKILKQQGEEATKQRVYDGRKEMEEWATTLKIPGDLTIEEISVNGISSVWLSTPESVKEQVILYLHGGGYMLGSINTHKVLGTNIARASKSRVLMIDYRLAPENPYPAALEDSVSAYKWLIDEAGINPKNIVISGDSAGGGLTAATLIKLREMGIPLPAAAVLLSPWADLEVTGDSVKTKRGKDPMLTEDELFFCANVYVEDNDPKNPYISPIYADMKDLPPLLIQVGSSELILDDSTRLAENAQSAGVEVILDVWEDMIHVFQSFAPWAPEGKQAIEKIGEFIQKRMKEQIQMA